MEASHPRSHYPHAHMFFGGFIFLIFILLLNEFATTYSIYFLYQWFDTPMHFIGGFGVGILGMGLLRAIFSKERYQATPQFWYTVLFVIVIGILWEVAETYYKVSVMFGGLYWFDTIKDLLMDTFGGILSYICFHPRTRKNSLSSHH